MPEEVVNAKAENELPTISKDKPEIIQEINSQVDKERLSKTKSIGQKSMASQLSKSSKKK